MKVLALALTTFLAATAYSQEALAPYPMQVECSPGERDYVGQRVCSALRDLITRSPRYRLTEKTTESRWVMHVVTVADSRTSTAGAVVLSFDTRESVSYLVSIWGVYTGTNKVDQQAGNIFASADALVVEKEKTK